MANEKGQNKGQTNQGIQKSRGYKDSSGTSGDSKKGNAFMNSEQKEISSKKRRKPSAESGNRSGSDSSHNQLNKSSSKKENQGRSKGVGKREGSQGKQGNPH
jgi:hypothetical protein